MTALVVLIIKITQFVTVHADTTKGRIYPDCFTEKRNCPQRIESTVRLLDSKLLRLEENLQKSENRVMRNEEEIVEIERKRIARDLHDTVSQELICSQYDLSGVATQAH